MNHSDDLAGTLARRLLKLVEIPSASFHEAALCDYLEIRLRALRDVAVQRIGDNLVVTVPAAGRKPTLLFAGHLDTVPPVGDEQPRIEGDLVFGRGASDLKASLAVLWLWLERTRLFELSVAPALVLYTCEEVAYSRSGLREVVAECPWLEKVDLAVCVEPSGNQVELGCLGTLHAEAIVRGRSAHSARPWQGENAIHAAVPLLARLAGQPIRDWSPDGLPEVLYREVVQITDVRGGRARNVLPDELTLNVNFRFAPDRTTADAKRHLTALIGKGVEVRFTDVAPAGVVAADHSLVRRLVELSGRPPRAKQAWTDVGRFSEWGVPAISFGPGLPAQAHQQNEHASVEAMVAAFELLEGWLPVLSPESRS